jgi:hypothetical protein
VVVIVGDDDSVSVAVVGVASPRRVGVLSWRVPVMTFDMPGVSGGETVWATSRDVDRCGGRHR